MYMVIPSFDTPPEEVGRIYKTADFYQELYGHRDSLFRPPGNVCVTELFMERFKRADADGKERAIEAIKRIEATPIIRILGETVVEPNTDVVDICGWRVIFSYDVGANMLLLYDLAIGHSATHTIRLPTNAGFGDISEEGLEIEEFILKRQRHAYKQLSNNTPEINPARRAPIEVPATNSFNIPPAMTSCGSNSTSHGCG